MAGSDRCAESAWVHVGNLEDLKARGMTVVQSPCGPLLVICEGLRCFAVDNRCPHLGFPLHRGSLSDGILTCHWHHARFDVASGGGFDLWADDLPTAKVQVRGGEVWVAAELCYADGEAHWKNRLLAGLEHNLALVIAKAILGLRMQGVAAHELVREAALFGALHRENWGTGLTTLAALANLLPNLPDDATYLALYKGIRNAAEDCEGQAARHAGQALDKPLPSQTIGRWFRHWTAVRHTDAAERTLLTAIHGGCTPAELAEIMLRQRRIASTLTAATASTLSTRPMSSSSILVGSTRLQSCRPQPACSQARVGRMRATHGVTRSISSRYVPMRRRKRQQRLLLASIGAAHGKGLPPWSIRCSVTRPTTRCMLSSRPYGRALRCPSWALGLRTRRRCESRASARPMNIQTGNRRITRSHTPTRCIAC
jgi:nitrite reductase/ring-hydroxylating ferredoxin subunit